MRTPINPPKKAKKALTSRSEPRLQSLRKSLKRKKRNQVKDEDNPNASNGIQQESKVARTEQNDSDVSENTIRAPICQVQMRSSENLRHCSDAEAKKSLTSEEVLNWLIKPVDRKKFFR